MIFLLQWALRLMARGTDRVILSWRVKYHMTRARVVAEGVESLGRRLQRRNTETRV